MRKAPIAFALLMVAACTALPGAAPSPGATQIAIASFTPSASPAPVTSRTSAPTTDLPPRLGRVIAGIDFAQSGGAADLRLESSISPVDETDLQKTIAADVQAVEREFERSFERRPVIYVFATTESYATGLARIFGYGQATATFVADNSVSFFEPSLRLIAVNWEAVGARRPIAAVRHELTHLATLDACTPRCDLVPAWLNEGQARLAEALVPGSDWRLLRVRYEAASMAATQTLIPLNALVSQRAWNALVDWAGYYKYQEAARATELLRDDIGGTAPMARVYERIRRGQSVAQAYAALTGRSFDDFVAGLPSRMRQAAPLTPGIVTLPIAPEGLGASYLLYGFTPAATVTLTITGPRGSESWPVSISPFGASFDSLAAVSARGLYTISAQDGNGVVTASVAKMSPGALGDPR